MIRVIRDVVNRNPRFRHSLGDVSLTSNNMITYQDVQVVVKDITSQGTRQSPDYFIATQMGRALIAKVQDKEGSFFEWVDEIDPTQVTPAAGVYMFNVDAVDEQTRKVHFTIQKYLWFEGSVRNAQGSRIDFAPGINALTVQPFDTTTNAFVAFEAAATYLYLLGPVVALGVKDVNGNPLTPVTDFWATRVQQTTVLQSTIFGTQTATIPANYSAVQLRDQDGYILRPGIDYVFTSATQVVLSQWTPAGNTITAQGTVRVDPSQPGYPLNPENTLTFTIPPGATIALQGLYIGTQAANNVPVTVNPNGSVQINTPLPPGGWLRYDLRALIGQSQAIGFKQGSNIGIIPGLRMAIGDQVMVGDQCAIIVSPHSTITYEVYGAKDNVNFTLDIKSNDPATSSELAELLKQELLVNRRTLMEADGVTILEASRSTAQNPRDRSATAPSWGSSLQISAMTDWRVFKPLVNRVTYLDIKQSYYSAYPGKPIPAPRYGVYGKFGFLPDYR